MNMEQSGLSSLDQLEKQVEELPESDHKTLMEYQIKSIRKMLEDIER